MSFTIVEIVEDFVEVAQPIATAMPRMKRRWAWRPPRKRGEVKHCVCFVDPPAPISSPKPHGKKPKWRDDYYNGQPLQSEAVVLKLWW